MDATFALLEATLDGLAALVAVVDGDGRVAHANKAWEHAAVHPWAGPNAPRGSEYAVALRQRASSTRDDAQALVDAIAAAHAGATPGTVVIREYAMGDPRAPTHWRTTMRVLPERHVLVQHEDVTSPRNTEAALKRSQARLRTILTGAPLVLFSLDGHGVFTLVEGMGAGDGGFAGPEQVGSSVFAAYAHMPVLLDVVRGALAGAVGVTTVHVGRLAFEVRCSPLVGIDHGIDGVVGVATDVSERVRLQRMKDELISIVSHELRTPLTSIRGSLGLLEGGVTGPLSAKALELVRIARLNTDRLVRLISDMLDLDKMEAGLLELQPTEMSLAEVVDASIREMSGLAAHVGVTLRRDAAIDGEPELPPLHADRDRIMQVLVNLLSNAIKFSPADASVRVALAHRGAVARVEVHDDGPGIAREDLGRLFQKFSQLDASDSRARGGSGLGLVICKRIIEASGGRIGVRSEPGVGSVFWLELPLPAQPSSEPAPASMMARRVVIEHAETPEVRPIIRLPRPEFRGSRIDELLARLREAADTESNEPLADAHGAAMILAAAMPEGSDAQVRLRACGQAIDAALAAPAHERIGHVRKLLREIEPLARRLHDLGQPIP